MSPNVSPARANASRTHADLPRVGPPRVGPPRVGPSQVGPPQVGPSLTGGSSTGSSTPDLARIPDDELIGRLCSLLADSRRVEADLLAHLGEVDARRLFAREAVPSMFEYCTRVLRLSEQEAYLRITVARCSRRHPLILPMLRDGRLHLSGAARIAPHLTAENADVLLGRAAGRTRREVDELLAEIAPRPDARTIVRKLPDRWTGSLLAHRRPLDPQAVDPRFVDPRLANLSTVDPSTVDPSTVHPSTVHPSTVHPTTVHPLPGASLQEKLGGSEAHVGPGCALATQLGPNRVESPGLMEAPSTAAGLAPSAASSAALSAAFSAASSGASSAPSHPPSPSSPSSPSSTSSSGGRVEPLAPGRYRVQFTASAALRDKLERLRALMRSRVPDGDLAAVIEEAVTEKIERLEARRFARVKAPRQSLADAWTTPVSRHVPAAVRRAVHARDGGQCTYRDAAGRRCPERDDLHFHHRLPFGFGCGHEAGTLGLMCRAHNALMAERDYGRTAMARFRRVRPMKAGDRVDDS